MKLTWEQLLSRLRDSGVLTEIELERSLKNQSDLVDGVDPAQAFADSLLLNRQITVYQYEQLLAGQHQTLVVGSYVILEPLAAGGMGQVFKARHRPMNRLVALKLIRPQLKSSPEATERFQREVRAAARLTHPNIVMSFDAGEVKQVHFLAMELIDGSDLRTLVQRQGPLPIPEAVDFTLQIARGLSHAHLHGIVHRDIKPANAIRDAGGTVKILDLGLAQLRIEVDASTMKNLTLETAAIGTVDYMAPEQAMNARDANELADQYSLGCTLHYLLTGRPVFGLGTTTARLLAHQTCPIPSLRDLRPEVPVPVDLAFQRMIAKRPQDRYPSLDDVISLLETSSVGWSAEATMTDGPTLNVSPEKVSFSDVKTMPRCRSSLLSSALAAFSRFRGFIWLIVTVALLGSFYQIWWSLRHNPITSPVASAKSNPKWTDEEAARWAVDVGGQISVATEHGVVWAMNSTELPAAPYQVLMLRLDPSNSPRNFDDEISHLAGLKHLKGFGATELLTDVGLQHLSRVSSLEEIRLLDCQITDRGLHLLSILPDLKILFVKSKDVTDEGLRTFSQAVKLTSLKLYARQFTGVGSRYLIPLTNLNEYELEDVPLTDSGLKVIGELTTLKKLAIVTNSPKVSDFRPLSKLQNLNSLTFSCSRFADQDVKVLVPLNGLRELSLAGSQVTGRTLEPLKTLQILKLQESKVDDAGAVLIAQLPEISVLELENTVVTGATMGPMTKLQSLGLQRTKVNDGGLAVIARLPNLKSLSLQQTQITEIGLRSLHGKLSLRELDLRNIRSITPDAVASLRATLPNCQVTHD